MIDDIFYLIINKSPEISESLYKIINKLEFNYTIDMIKNFKEDKIRMLKDILFVLYEFEKEKQNNIIEKIKRDDLISLYNVCKSYNIDNFISYFKKTIINHYNNSNR